VVSPHKNNLLVLEEMYNDSHDENKAKGASK